MRFVSSGVGIVLGGLFVYAGVQKHLAPYEFAEAILAYQLLPLGLVGLVTATLSWMEMVSGFSLILGCLLGSRRFSNPFPLGRHPPAQRPAADLGPIAAVYRRAAHHPGPGAEN